MMNTFNSLHDMLMRALILILATAVWSSLFAQPAGPFRAGPELLSTEKTLRTLPNISFVDIQGNPGRLSDYRQNLATVIVIRDAQCPLSKRYGHKLARLEREYAQQGVRFLYVNPAIHNALEDVWTEIGLFDFHGRYVVDRGQDFLSHLDGNSSTEVFVLDEHRRVLYRGAIDDQHGLGYSRDRATHHYLRDALDAINQRKSPGIASTTAPGCYLNAAERVSGADDLTFYRDVSPILQSYCQKCHHPNGIAPFPLVGFDDIFGRREMIGFVLKNKIMPPWFADHQGGPWANSLRLPESQRKIILNWIAQGAVAGDLNAAPPERSWSNKWKLGKPDRILQPDSDLVIPAEGTLPYRLVPITNNFDTDLWIRGFEVRSQTPKNTHHIIAFIDTRSDQIIDSDGSESSDENNVSRWALEGYFMGLVPGAQALMFPPGMAKKLPREKDLLLQIHYTTNGTAAVDRPEIGIYLADVAPEKQIFTNSAFSTDIRIQPNEENHKIEADYVFNISAQIIGFLPHTHFRGKAFKYELIEPGGERTVLLNAPRYDPNWQLYYQLATPVDAPVGSRIHATAWYDNSDKNPWNPDPSTVVRNGPQSWDEMMIGYFDWIEADPKLVP